MGWRVGIYLYLESFGVDYEDYLKRMQGTQLATMLAVKRLAGVTPKMNLRNNMQAGKGVSEKSTLDLKPRADVTRSPK